MFYKHWDKVPSENIKLLIKKIPHIEKDSIKAFLDKGVYFVREGVSELILYLNIEEFIKFLKTHNVSDYYNHKAVGDWAGKFSVSEDKKQILIKTEFVIDNSSSAKLRATCANNIITVRQMNESLVRGLELGWKFAKEMERGKPAKPAKTTKTAKTVRELEKETGLQHRTIYRYINLKYLSPRIVQDIFENKNPHNLRLSELMTLADKHLDFAEQGKEWN